MNENFGKKITAGVLAFCTLAYSTVPVFGYTKEESVYSKMDANGNVYHVTVSDHLKNMEKASILNDMSNLMNIENVSGDQEFKPENNTLTWKADGNDIYYQGSAINKELPIECKITYTLNGKEVSKEDIAGKTGNVKVTFEFINKEKRTVSINGKEATMYVPFVVGMGTIIDNENNKNIEISNGKVIDNGTKSIVFGVAFPGMQESLGISSKNIEIPSKVEISMDAKEFEMKEIYCFATPKLIDDEDFNLDRLNKMYDMASQLKNASTQLVDGSKSLSEGASKLSEGTQELSSKLNEEISKYENARKQLSNKEEIENKIANILNEKIKELAPELEELAKEEASNVIKANLKGENGIEAKTAETALEYSKIAMQEKINEIKNNKDEITRISKQLLEQVEKDLQIALKNIEGKEDVKALEQTIKQAIISDVTNTVKSKTSEVITGQVEAMEKSITDPTKLLAEADAKTLNVAKGQIVAAMVPGIAEQIKAQYAAQGGKIADEEAMAMAKQKAEASVSELVTTVSKKTMDKTLDTVATKAPEMAENTVKEIASKLSTEEAIEKAIVDYENKIIAEIKQAVGEETLVAIKENIKSEIIEEIEKSFKSDEVLQAQIKAYGNKAKVELNSTIDNVAEKTANKLAVDLSEELANQIASNLIKKQLNGELSSSEIDKELSKYEKQINTKLNEMDNQIATLKDALNQLTQGSNSLANGANELSEGMSKFDSDGIQKIYNLVNGDVKDFEQRVEKLKELANDYNTYTMIDESAENSSVKFIIMIDGISKDEKQREQAILPSEEKKDI